MATKAELLEQAKDLGIEGRTSMNKKELEKAVEKAAPKKERGDVGPSSSAAKKAAKKAGSTAEKKRKDAEARLKAEEVRSLDSDDPARGWDAQQGALPVSRTVKGLYDDDPPKYSKEQLPDESRLEEAGYKPIMREAQRD